MSIKKQNIEKALVFSILLFNFFFLITPVFIGGKIAALCQIISVLLLWGWVAIFIFFSGKRKFAKFPKPIKPYIIFMACSTFITVIQQTIDIKLFTQISYALQLLLSSYMCIKLFKYINQELKQPIITVNNESILHSRN